MTISTNDQSVDKAKYETGFDTAFGAPKTVKSGGYTQCPKTGKMVPRGTISRTSVNAPSVLRAIEEFKSPIDGQMISSRSQLAAHNKKHGVTNASDYSEGYIEGRAKARVNAGNKYVKESRKEDVTTMVDTILAK
jgi:hypothetical protein